ncbi:unnamed protein product [Arabidopsis halleri]
MKKIFTTGCGLTSPAGAGVMSHRILRTSLNNHYSQNVYMNLTRGFVTKPKEKDNKTQKVKKTNKVEEKMKNHSQREWEEKNRTRKKLEL